MYAILHIPTGTLLSHYHKPVPALANSIRYWCIGSDITRKCTTFTTHYKWYANRTIKRILKGGSFAILEAPEKELAKISCNTNEFEVIQYDPL